MTYAVFKNQSGTDTSDFHQITLNVPNPSHQA